MRGVGTGSGQAVVHRTRRARDGASFAAALLLGCGTVVFIAATESLWEVYMAVHIVSASLWVGGATALLVVALLTERTHDQRALANLMNHISKIGERVFTPSALLALASGIALVEKGTGDYGVFWIEFAFVVWAMSFITGAAFMGPTSKKLTVLIPERGLDDPETARKLKLVLRIARFDAALLLLVLIAMAAQPTF